MYQLKVPSDGLQVTAHLALFCHYCTVFLAVVVAKTSALPQECLRTMQATLAPHRISSLCLSSRHQVPLAHVIFINMLSVTADV